MRRSRLPGTRAASVARIPLCSLHLASCVRIEGRWTCPICMAESEEGAALQRFLPNRRARRRLALR